MFVGGGEEGGVVVAYFGRMVLSLGHIPVLAWSTCHTATFNPELAHGVQVKRAGKVGQSVMQTMGPLQGMSSGG